jgi:hypothetical protein
MTNYSLGAKFKLSSFFFNHTVGSNVEDKAYWSTLQHALSSTINYQIFANFWCMTQYFIVKSLLRLESATV